MLKPNGFSLIELMVSVAIAMFLMLGITAFFMASSKASMDNVQATRVNNTLRAAVELMSRDIARAGYWRDSSLHIGPNYANPFGAVAVSQYKTARDCVVFAYDANSDGILDPAEYRGFRLNGTVIEMKVAGSAWQCDEGTWQALTPSLIKVESLEFGLVSYGTASGTRTVVDRRVSIKLSGSASGDSAVRQNFDETINVRNDNIL
jgi:prepilin peptidase dependent protein B